jgi:hypothetical protein
MITRAAANVPVPVVHEVKHQNARFGTLEPTPGRFTSPVLVRVGQFTFFVVLVSNCSWASGRGRKGILRWIQQKIVCYTVFPNYKNTV